MRSRRGFTPVVVLAPLLALALRIGFWAAAEVRHTLAHLPQILQSQLSAALNREVRIGRVDGDFRQGLNLYDVAIARHRRLADGALFRARRIRIRYALDALLGRKAPPVESIRHVEVDQPWLFVSRNAGGRLNLEDLVRPGPPTKGPPQRFTGTLVIHNGVLVFEDRAVAGGRAIAHRLADLEVAVDGRAAPLYAGSVRARGEQTGLARFALTFSSDVERQSLSASARFEGVRLAAWLPYVPPTLKLPAKVTGGTADVVASVLVTEGRLEDYEGRVLLRGGGARVPGLRQPLRDVTGVFEVSPDAVSVGNLRLRAGRIALTGSGTLLGFRQPWLRARVQTMGVREADVRELVAGLPRLAGARVGRLNRLDVSVSGPLSDPQVTALADLESVQYRDVALTRVHMEARSAGTRALSIQRLTAQVAGGSLVATGQVCLDGKEPRYAARGTLRAVSLGALPLKEYTGTPAPTGRFDADFALTGEGAQPRAEARVRLSRAAWRDWHADAIEAVALYRDGNLDVGHAQVLVPEGAVTAIGSVDPKGPIRLQVAATDMEVAPLARRFGINGVSGHLHVRGEITGTLREPQFAGDLLVYRLAYGEDALDLVRGRLYADLKGVRLEDCRALMLPAEIGDIKASLTDLQAGAKPRLAGVAAVAGLDLRRLAQRLRLEGEWAGTIDVEELQVEGPLDALRVTALVTGRDLQGAGHSLDYVSGRVSATMDGAVEIAEDEPLTIRVGSSEVQAWGRLTPGRDLDVRVVTPRGKFIRAEDFYTPDPAILSLRTELGVNLRVTGTVSEPEVRHGAIAVQRLAINGHPFGLGDGEIELRGNTVRLNQLVLLGDAPAQPDRRREQYDVSGTLLPTLDLTAAVQEAPVAKLLGLARVRRLPFEVRGRVTALIKARAGDSLPRVSLTRLEVAGGGIGPQEIQSISAQGLSLEADSVTLSRLRVALPEGGVLDVAGKASLAEGGPVSLQVSGTKLDLALVQPWAPLPQRLGGVGTLSATVSGTSDRPVLDGTLDVEKPQYGEALHFDSLTAKLSYRDGVARVSDIQVKRGPYHASGFAEVPFTWPAVEVPGNGRLSGLLAIEKQSLDALTLFLPGLQERVLRVAGTVSALLEVGGTPRQPDYRGSILLSADEVVLGNRPKGRPPEVALRLVGIEGAIRLERDRILVERVSLASGSNPQALLLSGSVRMQQFRVDELDLKVVARDYLFDAKNLSGQFQERVRFALDGEGSLRGTLASHLVAGDFRLRRTKVDISKYVAPPPSSEVLPVSPTRFDLRLATAGDAEVVAMRSTATVNVTTTVRGDLNHPIIEGRATANRGSVDLTTAYFRLTEATVDFRIEPPKPFVARGTAVLTTNLRGRDPQRKETQTYAVKAEVTLDFPKPGGDPVGLTLTSTPFREQRDLQAMLLRQDVLEALVGSGSNQRLGDTLKEEVIGYMATALQPRVFEPVERALVDALGLSEFSIQASFEEPVEVRMGKYLVKGLRVSYTRSMSAREARYKFKVDYQVMPRISVSWTTDDQRIRVLGLEAGVRW